MISRREFLVGSAALALGACTRRLGEPAAKRTRYYVATQVRYLKFANDIGTFADARKVDLPGMKFSSKLSYTLLTGINDDGTGVQRLLLPTNFHCVTPHPGTGLIYLVGMLAPSWVVALDPTSLNVVATSRLPDGDSGLSYAGHGEAVPGTNCMAFLLNGPARGKFDRISIRDASTLRELAQYSSYGFAAHEIRITADQKHFLCGHYGSYIDSGAYTGFGAFGPDGLPLEHPPRKNYPASVTLVNVRDGSLARRCSDVSSGQQGHAVADEENNIFLPNDPTPLRNRPGIEHDGRFLEVGEAVPEGFARENRVLGLCIAYDPKFQELVVPGRNNAPDRSHDLKILVTNAKSASAKMIDLMPQAKEAALTWVKPRPFYVHGLDFHSDGKHYILSTSDGILAVERGTHRLVPRLSFPLPLFVHSHVRAVQA